MRFTRWATKDRDTHSEYLISCSSTAIIVRRTRLNAALYVHCLNFLFTATSSTPAVSYRKTASFGISSDNWGGQNRDKRNALLFKPFYSVAPWSIRLLFTNHPHAPTCAHNLYKIINHPYTGILRVSATTHYPEGNLIQRITNLTYPIYIHSVKNKMIKITIGSHRD
jgi:hypothetical protein